VRVPDKEGRVKIVKDALGHETKFDYDEMGRVKTQTDAKQGITSYTYTKTNKVETITDAMKGVTTYTYDALDRVLTETNPEGETTTYTYDALGHVKTVKNPLGHIESFDYDKMGRIETVTDQKGAITTYHYDKNGNLTETIDALGHKTTYVYDVMNHLKEVHQIRTDLQDGIQDEEQITTYTYDKRGLVKTEVKGDTTTSYDYDANGNRTKIIDAEGNLTVYAYDARNLVETINYQDGKTVTFGYNKNGILKTTEDWTGAMTFELDLLGRIKSANDQNNKITSYTYDAVGNKETMTYPDNKVVTYGYDALNRMKTVTDGENQVTTYDYDKASRVTGMTYPNGWKELNVYDDAGQVLTVHDQSPGNTVKNLKFQYAYDNNGNVTREYRRGTGLGQKKEDYTHVYDDLNRLIQTSGLYGKTQTNYTYDTLSNLTFEQSGTTKTVDYDYNSLNQQISKIVNNKDQYTNTFDKRGNLTQVTYNTKNRVEESYVYDATNRMVKGTNAIGEESAYLYTGLGDLIQNTWTVKKNAYGYHDVQLTTAVTGEDTTIIRDTPTSTTGKKKDVATPEQVAADMTLNQTSTIQKTYVIDYTSMYKDAIMETETGGLTYRYTFGLEKISAVLSPVDTSAGSIVQNGTVKLYYHRDRLGNTDYLTDNVQSKAVSYVRLPLKSIIPSSL
jgi:YD repeat-containing protein